MRVKFKKIKQKGDASSIIKVILDKKDAFNYVMAMHLSNNTVKGLLPFSFSENSVAPDFFYNATGLVPLDTVLETKQSLEQFQSLLRQVASLLDTLQSEGMLERNIVFDPGNIYIDVEGHFLQFIYLPLDSQPVQEHAVFDLLLHIAIKARFVVESDKTYADSLVDFIDRKSVV
jgi:hypothetical protein